MSSLGSSFATALITAPTAAALTAYFTFGRFQREKIWERKAAAYTAIFQALHDMRCWYYEHYEAEILDRDIPDGRAQELRDTYQKARDELYRRLAGESWMFSGRISRTFG